MVQGDLEAVAEGEVMLSVLASLQGQGEQVKDHDRRAVALLQDAGPSEAKALVLSNLAGSLTEQLKASEAVPVARQALAIANELALDQARVLALMALGVARVFDGDPDGLLNLEQAVTVAVATNSVHGAMAYNSLGIAVIALGQLARGFQLQAKARELAKHFGTVGDLHLLRFDQVLEDYWRGRWDSAAHEAERLIAEAQAGSLTVLEPECRIVRGRIRLARGDPDGALQDAVTGLKRIHAANDKDTLYALLSLEAHAALAAGDAGSAGAKATELLAVLAEQGPVVTASDWSGELAIVIEALGRGVELLEHVASLKASSLWLQAAWAIAIGDFEHAVELYAKIGSLPDEALARLRAAERLVAARLQAEASLQLQPALAFFQEVGASAYVREAEALLANSA